jgi:hypothetical protein
MSTDVSEVRAACIIRAMSNHRQYIPEDSELQSGQLFNLLRSYLIKGLAIPLVGIKYPTISTNLLKHSNRRKGE